MYIFHIVLTLNVDEYIGSKKISIELQVNDGDIFSEKKGEGIDYVLIVIEVMRNVFYASQRTSNE